MNASTRGYRSLAIALGGAAVAALAIILFVESQGGTPAERSGNSTPGVAESDPQHAAGTQGTLPVVPASFTVRTPPEFVDRGVEWLIKAQHTDGGWGAGSHAHQDVRDPHQVVVDPATTAFVASALLRYGHTPTSGTHQAALRKATEYLCKSIETYDKPGPKITDLEGTQIQSKLGPLVDTAMTAQYLARVLPELPKSDALRARVDRALTNCLAKLEQSQQENGSWNVGGGWAPVLQSSLGCAALEYAQSAGKEVSTIKLDRARKYQLGNYDAATGQTNAAEGAGVALYAFSGSLRGVASQSKAADALIDEAKKDGKLGADAPVSEENLLKAGASENQVRQLYAAKLNSASQVLTLNGAATFSGGTVVAGVASSAPMSGVGGVAARTAAPGVPPTASTDEALLAGFGNNGGEEFLSYMFNSESMVIVGQKDWDTWREKMLARLAKVQNPDGSWSGHHCITSPVFCTAAVVQTLTADRDAELLARLARDAAKVAKLDPAPATRATAGAP